MVALHRTRVLVVALGAVVALAAGCSSDADPDAAPTSSATTTATTPAAPTDDQLCAAFLQFADAQAQHAGAQNAETTEALIRTGLVLASLPPTASMSDGVHASLVQLVAQTLDGVVQDADLPVVEGTPDEPEFSAYLNQYCPA